MIKLNRQYDLFKNNYVNTSEINNIDDIFINKKTISSWQEKIINHQYPIFKYGYKLITQKSIMASGLSLHA